MQAARDTGRINRSDCIARCRPGAGPHFICPAPQSPSHVYSAQFHWQRWFTPEGNLLTRSGLEVQGTPVVAKTVPAGAMRTISPTLNERESSKTPSKMARTYWGCGGEQFTAADGGRHYRMTGVASRNCTSRTLCTSSHCAGVKYRYHFAHRESPCRQAERRADRRQVISFSSVLSPSSAS